MILKYSSVSEEKYSTRQMANDRRHNRGVSRKNTLTVDYERADGQMKCHLLTQRQVQTDARTAVPKTHCPLSFACHSTRENNNKHIILRQIHTQPKMPSNSKCMNAYWPLISRPHKSLPSSSFSCPSLVLR